MESTHGNTWDLRRLLAAVNFLAVVCYYHFNHFKRTVCFCLLLWAGLLAPPAASAAPANAQRMVVLGDSLAAGFGLDPDESFPALLQKKMEKLNLPVTVVNAGVSGDTTAGGLRRIDWVLKQPLDILLIELGGNDGLRGIAPEATKTNLQMLIHRAKTKHPDLKVIVAGMKMPANMGTDYSERFHQIFAEVASATQAALIPFLLEGVAGSSELNQADRIHPTAAGQKIVAENVWKILRPLVAPGQ